MNDRRTLSSSLSSEVLKYLRGKDFSQAEIARMLGVSESFVSLVKSRERGLTLDHIESLASALNLPLGVLMVAVTAPQSGDGEMTRITERLILKVEKLLGTLRQKV